ncbi:uncharacterized protein SCHCODRAFT_02636064 [Schizophyllum commune H4-8]|uniref:uncharacterized protein n=1 Tax=Schizophyllum commune (strain H4-8 / FGSC 9210) TaxID=578458 RepID=UPI00215F4A08|nr:uncharacterized protein SCHCODRAFT_02636064 [Schizophyllum commune H4-8]KAI5888216.1 hypothetical protein SCHCODRAFT_02636064 [Schizophyllum commune H4-8]
MTEPITVIPPAPEKCQVYGARAGIQLLRCSTCKNRSYCSAVCQKKDWKWGHKLRCSLLPVPLAPLPIHPSEKLSFEVRRAAAALEPIYEVWQYIDETVEPEKKNEAKKRDESYVSLLAHTLPHPFAWSDTWEYRLGKDGTSLPETTLFAFRHLFWIDTVSHLDTPAQRTEWLEMLGNPAFTAHTTGIVPEKALARPGELSPGEYETIEQVVVMSSFIRRIRRGSMERRRRIDGGSAWRRSAGRRRGRGHWIFCREQPTVLSTVKRHRRNGEATGEIGNSSVENP